MVLWGSEVCSCISPRVYPLFVLGRNLRSFYCPNIPAVGLSPCLIMSLIPCSGYLDRPLLFPSLSSLFKSRKSYFDKCTFPEYGMLVFREQNIRYLVAMLSSPSPFFKRQKAVVPPPWSVSFNIFKHKRFIDISFFAEIPRLISRKSKY